MKSISLIPGGLTLVSDCDYWWAKRFSWNNHQSGYVAYNSNANGIIYLHRMIMEHCDPFWIDHIDGNPLNNVRSNLRLVTPSENSMNRRGQRNSFSKYKGIYWYKRHQKWVAKITCNGIRHELGYFDKEIDAAKAFDAGAKKYQGKFAILNFPI